MPSAAMRDETCQYHLRIRYKLGLLGMTIRDQIRYLRVTALDTPTRQIRQNLVYPYRHAQETEAAPWRLF